MRAKYETPGIARGFFLIGILTIIGGIAFLFPPFIEQMQVRVYVCVSLCFASLVYFAIGAVLDNTAKTAFWAEQGARSLDRMVDHAAALRSEVTAAAQRQASVVAADSQYYYMDTEGETQGPVTMDQLRRYLKARKITEETLIARQGSEDWQAISTLR